MYLFRFVMLIHFYTSLFRLTASGVVDGPRERSGHRIIYHEGSIYSFGGYNPDQALEHDPAMLNDPGWMASKPLFKELWKFNTYTSKCVP